MVTNDGRDADPLKAFLVYFISAAPKLDRKELIDAIKISFPRQGPALMSTIAEQYFLEGIEQGIEKGIEQGELIGVIQTCQSILKQLEMSEDELRLKPIVELQALAQDLKERLRTRFEVK